MSEKLLILDLDETLIHAAECPVERAADFMIGSKYHVYKRPGLDAFINFCFASFTVAVWTSSSPLYAAMVVPSIFPDPSKLRFVWASDRCSVHRNLELHTEHWVKSLRKIKRLGFTLEQTLMIDDSPEKMIRNYGNHIRVDPYEGDLNDRELPLLVRYLNRIRDVPNVRSVEKRRWKHDVEQS